MLTYKKYNAIRILLQSGEEIDAIAETLVCRRETVLLVKRCETYEQYKQESVSLKAIAKAAKAKKDNAPTAAGMNISQIKIEATHYMMEELKKNNELLTLISNKLTAIMDELGVMNK